jgi:transcriptional regulator with XRE-family HTH domain
MTRLQLLRLQARLTQCDLARKLGYRTSFGICMIERNPRPDDPRISKRLRRALEEFFQEPYSRLIETVDLARALAA